MSATYTLSNQDCNYTNKDRILRFCKVREQNMFTVCNSPGSADKTPEDDIETEPRRQRR